MRFVIRYSRTSSGKLDVEAPTKGEALGIARDHLSKPLAGEGSVDDVSVRAFSAASLPEEAARLYGAMDWEAVCSYVRARHRQSRTPEHYRATVARLAEIATPGTPYSIGGVTLFFTEDAVQLVFCGTARRKSPRAPAPRWWAELRDGEVKSGAPSEELLAANLGRPGPPA